MNMRKVYLYGSLGKKYGVGPHLVSGETTQQVFQGLCCLLGPGFKKMVKEGHFNILRDKKSKENNMLVEEVSFQLGKTEKLFVYPCVSGRGKWGSAIVGLVMFVVGAIITFGSAGTASPLGTQLMVAGAGMLLGGILTAIATPPSMDVAEQPRNPSFIFNGTVNVTEQGGPVPVVMGRCPRASSVVLSAGLSNQNQSNG